MVATHQYPSDLAICKIAAKGGPAEAGSGRRYSEVDRRIPLCIGGADDVRNLCPQEGFDHFNCHDKNALEDQVCLMVCVTAA